MYTHIHIKHTRSQAQTQTRTHTPTRTRAHTNAHTQRTDAHIHTYTTYAYTHTHAVERLVTECVAILSLQYLILSFPAQDGGSLHRYFTKLLRLPEDAESAVREVPAGR